VRIPELPDYVTERGNAKNQKGVRDVAVTFPAAWLKGGIRLVDTPGIGSVQAHNTEVTYQYLPQADAVIFVASVDQPAIQRDNGQTTCTGCALRGLRRPTYSSVSSRCCSMRSTRRLSSSTPDLPAYTAAVSPASCCPMADSCKLFAATSRLMSAMPARMARRCSRTSLSGSAGMAEVSGGFFPEMARLAAGVNEVVDNGNHILRVTLTRTVRKHGPWQPRQMRFATLTASFYALSRVSSWAALGLPAGTTASARGRPAFPRKVRCGPSANALTTKAFGRPAHGRG
jgi:hypothetical protein